jgi:hypothetical protein
MAIVSEDNVKLLLGLSSSITDEEQSFITLIHPQAEGAVRSHLKYDPEQKVHAEVLPRHLRAGGPGYDDNDGLYTVTNDAVYWQPAGGCRTLQLTHLPLRAITTVHVDTNARHGDSGDPFPTSTLWTSGTDYHGDWDQDDVGHSGQLYAYGTWPSEPGTVQIVYRAGYSSTEFAGNATADSVAGDGTITTAYLDGSPIALAVQDTIVNMFTRAMSLKKKSGLGFVPGTLSGEKLGDYSYTIDTARSTIGTAALSDYAKELLEPFTHYGLDRL